MTYRSLIAAAGIVLATLIGTPAGAQQKPLAAAEVTKIQGEVHAAMLNYVKLFGERDLKTIVEKVFAHPAMSITSAGVKLQTPEDVKANYTRMFDDLAKTQYDHSDAKISVCVLTPTMAIASGTFRRINKDGSLLMEGSTAYLFTKMSDGWRITSGLGVQPGKTVTCN